MDHPGRTKEASKLAVFLAYSDVAYTTGATVVIDDDLLLMMRQGA